MQRLLQTDQPFPAAEAGRKQCRTSRLRLHSKAHGFPQPGRDEEAGCYSANSATDKKCCELTHMEHLPQKIGCNTVIIKALPAFRQQNRSPGTLVAEVKYRLRRYSSISLSSTAGTESPDASAGSRNTDRSAQARVTLTSRTCAWAPSQIRSTHP